MKTAVLLLLVIVCIALAFYFNADAQEYVPAPTATSIYNVESCNEELLVVLHDKGLFVRVEPKIDAPIIKSLLYGDLFFGCPDAMITSDGYVWIYVSVDDGWAASGWIPTIHHVPESVVANVGRAILPEQPTPTKVIPTKVRVHPTATPFTIDNYCFLDNDCHTDEDWAIGYCEYNIYNQTGRVDYRDSVQDCVNAAMGRGYIQPTQWTPVPNPVKEPRKKKPAPTEEPLRIYVPTTAAPATAVPTEEPVRIHVPTSTPVPMPTMPDCEIPENQMSPACMGPGKD